MISQTLIMSTQAFLDKLQKRATEFKSTNGFGRWLKEYQNMEADGLFEPVALKNLYIDYLKDKFEYGYMYLSAVKYIATLAYDDTVQYLANSDFCIMTNEGEIAKDDDYELIELEFCEALDICKAINDDALDYIVYIADGLTEKYVYRL